MTNARVSWRCWAIAWTAVVGARAAAAQGSPAATQPTTTSAPATQPAPVQLAPDIVRKWRGYMVTWNVGRSIESQSRADHQLVEVILKADPAQLAALRELMIAEYERLAGLPKGDDFHCARMASRIAWAWTRGPTDKRLTAVQVIRNKKRLCEEVCRWGLRSVQHFAGDVAEKHWTRYRVFLPGTAVSMMSLMVSRALVIDKPGDLRDELVKIRPGLLKLAEADEVRQAQMEAQFAEFYKAMESFGKLQADKAAVRKVVVAFEAAYNGRDDKAFGALWPKGHPATRFLQNRPLADKIEPSYWKIVHWEPVYVVVKGDLASTYVISQYQTKDGKLHPVKLQAFPAKRHPKEGWKLN